MKKTTNTSAKETKAAKKVTATTVQAQPKKAEKAPKPKYNGEKDAVLIEVITKAFPELTVVKKAGTHNVDLLRGRNHVLATKYVKKSGKYVLYFSRKYFAFIEESLNEETRKNILFHEKWGMPYEMKDVDEKIFKSLIPAIKKAMSASKPAAKEEAKAAA